MYNKVTQLYAHRDLFFSGSFPLKVIMKYYVLHNT